MIGIASTLRFDWGIGRCVLLAQGSTLVGVYNAVKPMSDEGRNQQRLVSKWLNRE